MHVPFLDLTHQNAQIRHLAIDKFSEVFDSSSFILGQEVATFEKNIAQYLGTKHAIGVSSGTDAILIALMSLGIKPGDEVICPSFTFFATAGCIVRLGAHPVFADIDIDDFNISLKDLERKISPKTKAIVPVHLFGQAANIDEIVAFSEKLGIPVVEDCAQSFGAKRHNQQTGTFGNIGCFSFYPSKNLGGFGDSGIICTNDDVLAEKLKILRVHGMKPQYFHKYVSGNFRIDELQAALLNLKLSHVNDYINKRREHANFYLKELAPITEIVLPQEKKYNWHTWNQFTIRVLNSNRDKLAQFLKEANIGNNIYYPLPLDAQECFQNIVDNKRLTQVAAIASQEVLSLPIFPELSNSQIEYIAETIMTFFK